MREHEVPTHVQAEDRVLLWFTLNGFQGWGTNRQDAAFQRLCSSHSGVC